METEVGEGAESREKIVQRVNKLPLCKRKAGGDVPKDCPGRSADKTAKEAVGGGGKCRPLVVDEAREEWGAERRRSEG